MIFTQPYRLPTISCLYEMRTAGGGDSKLYRPRLPFNPYEVVWCCPKSLIFNHLMFTFIYNAFMLHPTFPVPQFVICGYRFNWNQSFICKDKLSLRNTSQFSLFSFLPQMSIDAMFLYRHMEHLACRCAVNIAAILKNFEPPPLPGKPGNYPGLNGREIRYNELPAILRHKCRADKLGKGIRDIFIEHGKGFIITASHQCPCLYQIRYMVLGQILQLDQTPGEPACPIGSVKLEHPMGPAICADCVLHRRVFFYTALGELLPE